MPLAQKMVRSSPTARPWALASPLVHPRWHSPDPNCNDREEDERRHGAARAAKRRRRPHTAVGPARPKMRAGVTKYIISKAPAIPRIWQPTPASCTVVPSRGHATWTASTLQPTSRASTGTGTRHQTCHPTYSHRPSGAGQAIENADRRYSCPLQNLATALRGCVPRRMPGTPTRPLCAFGSGP